jgi:hypothetical protein
LVEFEIIDSICGKSREVEGKLVGKLVGEMNRTGRMVGEIENKLVGLIDGIIKNLEEKMVG